MGQFRARDWGVVNTEGRVTVGQQQEFIDRVTALREKVANTAVFGAIEGVELCDALIDAFKVTGGTGVHYVDTETGESRELTKAEVVEVLNSKLPDEPAAPVETTHAPAAVEESK